MGARDVRGDGQAQPHAAALVLIARRVQPRKGFLRIGAAVFGDAGAVILDPKAQGFFGQGNADIRLGPVAHGVVD